jgi:hypothetical protein
MYKVTYKMTYTLSELSSKYDTLWDQQDELFCELSSLKNRQQIVEYSNSQLIKMEKQLNDLHSRIHILHTKMDDIFYLIEYLKKSNHNNQYIYNIIIVSLIIILYFVK